MRHELSNQELEAALKALGGLEPAGVTSDRPAPALEGVLDRAGARTTVIRRNTMLRNIASTVLLLLAGTLATVLMTLAPHNSGWAVSDGWIVEYEIDVPAYYDGDYGISMDKDPDSPQSRLERLVDDFSAKHQDAAPLPGQALASLRTGQALQMAPELLLRRAKASLVFTSADEDLLEELLAILRQPGAGLPAMAGPEKRYSKQWYASEKYPERFEPREVLIDGKPRSYPQDFESEAELENIRRLIMPQVELFADSAALPAGPGGKRHLLVCYNLLSAATRSRTGAGMVLEVSLTPDGAISFDTLLAADPYPELQSPECRATCTNALPAGDGKEERIVAMLKPNPALQQTAATGPAAVEDSSVKLEVFRLVCLLYPAERFEPGKPAGSYTPTLSEGLRAAALRAEYMAAIDRWLDAHPGYRSEQPQASLQIGAVNVPAGPARSVRVSDVFGSMDYELLPDGTVNPDSPMPVTPPYVGVKIDLRGVDSAERASLKEALEQVQGPAPIIEWRLHDVRVNPGR